MTKRILKLSLAGLLVCATQNSLAVKSFEELERVGDNFTFVINTDAHVNRARSAPGRQAGNNEIFADFIKEVNAMPSQPAFVMFNGDIYERQAVPDSTNTLARLSEGLNTLAIGVTGNHDVRDFDVEHIFGPMQKAWNGRTDHTFSFDCGRWHFVVMPTRELVNTRAKEEAFLKWLDADLEANKNRPTMAFTHYHVLPVGTSQLEFYAYPIQYKNRLVEVLTRYGNVRYVFSGHVHSGIQTLIKTAWIHKGTQFLIVPSGVRPRPFGEEFPEFTMDGGYYMVVQIKGNEARLIGRQNGRPAQKEYPPTKRAFDIKADPRHFTAAWDLPVASSLENGGFEQGLDKWHKVFRYMKDTDPGYVFGTTGRLPAKGKQAASLYVGERGQNWALGEFTELYQMVASPGKEASLSFRYKGIEAQNGGGYLWLAGFKGPEAQCMALFQWGPTMRAKHTLPRVINYVLTAGEHDTDGLGGLRKKKQAFFWKLPEAQNEWASVDINLANAFNVASGKPGLYETLKADRFMVGIGAWCSEEPGSKSTAMFDEISFADTGSEKSTVAGKPFDPLDQGYDQLVQER